jgi:hypothetical protein
VHDHYPDARVVYFYRSSNPGYALNFGNVWTANCYQREIASAYPNYRSWNIWTKQYDTGPDTDTVQFFQGTPAFFNSFGVSRLVGKHATLVFGNDVEALYELK